MPGRILPSSQGILLAETIPDVGDRLYVVAEHPQFVPQGQYVSSQSFRGDWFLRGRNGGHNAVGGECSVRLRREKSKDPKLDSVDNDRFSPQGHQIISASGGLLSLRRSARPGLMGDRTL